MELTTSLCHFVIILFGMVHISNTEKIRVDITISYIEDQSPNSLKASLKISFTQAEYPIMYIPYIKDSGDWMGLLCVDALSLPKHLWTTHFIKHVIALCYSTNLDNVSNSKSKSIDASTIYASRVEASEKYVTIVSDPDDLISTILEDINKREALLDLGKPRQIINAVKNIDIIKVTEYSIEKTYAKFHVKTEAEKARKWGQNLINFEGRTWEVCLIGWSSWPKFGEAIPEVNADKDEIISIVKKHFTCTCPVFEDDIQVTKQNVKFLQRKQSENDMLLVLLNDCISKIDPLEHLYHIFGKEKVRQLQLEAIQKKYGHNTKLDGNKIFEDKKDEL